MILTEISLCVKMILTEISLWVKMILTEISLWLKMILAERVNSRIRAESNICFLFTKPLSASAEIPYLQLKLLKTETLSLSINVIDREGQKLNRFRLKYLFESRNLFFCRDTPSLARNVKGRDPLFV